MAIDFRFCQTTASRKIARSNVYLSSPQLPGRFPAGIVRNKKFSIAAALAIQSRAQKWCRKNIKGHKFFFVSPGGVIVRNLLHYDGTGAQEKSGSPANKTWSVDRAPTFGMQNRPLYWERQLPSIF